MPAQQWTRLMRERSVDWSRSSDVVIVTHPTASGCSKEGGYGEWKPQEKETQERC